VLGGRTCRFALAGSFSYHRVVPQALGSVLVVDDDPAVRKVLGALLAQAGIGVTEVESAKQALAHLDQRGADVVLTDVRMPGMDGFELLVRVTEQWPGIPVILLTAHGTVPFAVEAMKRGAYDFMLKPFDREEVLYVVEKALARAREDRTPPARPPSHELRGTSAPMRQVQDLVERAARSTATVLIRGESGTGKELIARAIHEGGPRREAPLVKLSCAALPDTLLESELFGYEKGAFTGAAGRKPGRIELAHGGTLFLDEIGDVPVSTQVKLLRVLQEREFERLGGTETVKVDVRFVAATHRSLEAMVEKREFREDLFYRLNVIPIHLPPLRARPDDIAPLARHFASAHGPASDRPAFELAAAAVAMLETQPWPGNVRQLQNFVERLIVLSDGPLVTAEDVRRELERELSWPGGAQAEQRTAAQDVTLQAKRRDAERDALALALARARGNRTVAARILGISRRTLYNKLEELGLS
jgi:two-component system, NtrC family, response regulator AtoC